ncbi:MAG: VOC family protein [Actinomycetota bacterium]|nr:VOC family protein [Actinomycetota bacterium]
MPFREAFPVVYAADVERSLAFYRDLFGFELVYRWPPDGAPDFAFLRLDPLGIALAAHSAPEELLGRSPVAGSPPRFELCIYADDVDRAAEDLARGGARILVPPTDQPWGERLLYVEDPDGNPIQVTAKTDP